MLVFILTTEMALAVVFRAVGIRGMHLLWATELIGSVSFVYWYWVGSYFLRQPSKAQQATLEFIQQTDGWFRHYFHSHIATVLVLGLVFVIGLTPVLWIGAVVFCEGEKSKAGVVLLFAANAVKIALSVLLLLRVS